MYHISNIYEYMECKYCGEGARTVKNGRVDGVQRYLCRECGHQFLDNGHYPDMETDKQIIALALDLYFEGLSVRKVGRQLKKIYGLDVDPSTIWDWIQKYSKEVKRYVDTLQADLEGHLHADETMITSKGEGDPWYWEVIDRETRYLVASHVSRARTDEDAVALFKQAKKRSVFNPFEINVDGLGAYNRGYNRNFYNRYIDRRPVLNRRVGMEDEPNNNPVERLHGTWKDRARAMRGLGSNRPGRKRLLRTIQNVLGGWDVHYNFCKPHTALDGRTPAQAANVEIRLNDGWADLIQLAIIHNTKYRF